MKRRTFLASAAAAAALPLPAIAQSEKQRVLKFVPQANLTSLDPVWTTAGVTMNHGYYVFDTLFGVDSEQRAHPQMAEGHTVSDDGRTYLIKLREGLVFHDGTPVRAQDCAPSLKRWSVVDTFGQTLARAVDAWEAADDRTIRIRLKEPFPLLIDALAKPSAVVPFMMPERFATSDPRKAVTEMVGSGPYRFIASEFVPGSRVAYEKFDKYNPRSEAPQWTMGAKKAIFPRIEWHVIPDPGVALAALQTGEVDWVEQVLPELVPVLQKVATVKLGIIDPNGFFGCLRFNSTQPPFNNVKLRRAIMRAIDPAVYLASVTNSDPSAYEVCHTFFPCGTKYAVQLNPDPMGPPPSIEAAKAMVAESGYKGEKIAIFTPVDMASLAPFGKLTHELFLKLGLNSELVERRTSKEPVEKGGWSVYHTWWFGDSILMPAMNAMIRGQGAQGWFGWYESPRMEALNAEWLKAPTEDERKAIAAKMQALAFEDVPTIPFGSFQIRTAYSRSLDGMIQGPAPLPWGVHRV
jgi:peptide/nickel transport system substrate-binding protein